MRNGWEVIQGAERLEFLDRVWDMVVTTYRPIGVPHKSPTELTADYDRWELFFAEGEPVAFSLTKRTPYGNKTGVSGSDGTLPGRAAIKGYLRMVYSVVGRYSEVSHKVEEIALGAGAPVVCAAYVPNILNKSVEPQDDGVHYRRAITGVGVVKKIMVGRPKGVPITDINNPDCPLGAFLDEPNKVACDEASDRVAHLTCLALDSHL